VLVFECIDSIILELGRFNFRLHLPYCSAEEQVGNGGENEDGLHVGWLLVLAVLHARGWLASVVTA